MTFAATPCSGKSVVAFTRVSSELWMTLRDLPTIEKPYPDNSQDTEQAEQCTTDYGAASCDRRCHRSYRDD
eukprot:scaffold1564_cov389-Prasinococcus_capsulatus_cf.AAC.21